MLNFTPATVTPGSESAEVYAAQAAMRPLAGFGAGAFACGTWAASPVNERVAAPALPRIRRVFAPISLGHPQTSDVVGGGYQPVLASTVLASTKQLDQMARINPVTPGGLGPHPAREPEPV
jgi:hypothetical protein